MADGGDDRDGNETVPERRSRPEIKSGTKSGVPEMCGSYRFGEVIAEGGMGRIYRAFDTSLGRDVAIKVPRVTGEELLYRFQREVAITARLSHSGIVPLHGAGNLPDGTPFYVMRFIEGTPLDAAVATATRDERLKLVERVLAVAETMAYAHRERVIHRDLKPNNVLIGKFGETLIIDWGLAKSLGASEPAASESRRAMTPNPASWSDQPIVETVAGDVMGTPAFMAPEQAAGEAVDCRADVYALGRMLDFVLAGKLVPVGAAFDAPAALRAISTKATAQDPDARHADAGELAAALRAALAPPRARRWPLFAAAALMLAGAGVWFAFGRARHREPAQILGRAPADTRRLAVSPSGDRLAISNNSGVEVRELDGTHTWRHTDSIAWPGMVQFESESVVTYAALGGSTDGHRVRWDLAADTATSLEPPTSGAWLGSIAAGELYLATGVSRGIEIRAASGTRRAPGFEQQPVRLWSIAPSRKRFAFFDGRDRSSGVIRVVDAATLATTVSPTLVDISALSWLDDDTLVYAEGDSGHAALYRASASEHGLASAQLVYDRRGHDDWIGMLGAHAGRVIAIFAGAESENVLLDATGKPTVLDTIPLVWRDGGHLLALNPSSHRVEDRPLAGSATVTEARIADGPVNATRADDMLIVSMRGAEGRLVEAYDTRESAPKWSIAPLSFVRCAGDTAAPCIAGSSVPGGSTELRRIDPRTGALGDVVVPGAAIDDAAIDRTGTRVAWIEDFSFVRARSLTGGEITTLASNLGGMHTIAFDANGDVLVAFALGSGRQILRIHDGKLEPVLTDPANMIGVVRGSPDGTHLFYRRRIFVFDLAEVHLP
jgi:serine/threonine protein kinase